MIDFRQLRQFEAVARHLHFRRAAEELNIAQPPLSQAIKRLEQTLGVQLLERTKKSVALTPAGRVFLAETEKTLAQAQRAVEMARAANEGSVGKIAIGFVGSATYSVLPSLLSRFRQQHPNVELELNEMTTLDQFEALAQGRIQAGFLRPPLPFDKAIRTQIIHREPLRPIFNRAHPLAGVEEVRLADLASENFISFPASRVPSIFTLLMLACKEAGFAPRITQTALQIQTMISLVAGGMGISLVPESAQAVLPDTVVMTRLADRTELLNVDLAIAWREDLAVPAFQDLLALCRQDFERG